MDDWELQQAQALRKAVFVVEQGIFQTSDHDLFDSSADTLIATIGMLGIPDAVVGTVRIHEQEPGVWIGSRLAVDRATTADLKFLRQQLRDEHEAMHRFDQPAWARLASSFHLKLGELGRNPILQRYLVEMVSRCSLIVALYEPPGNACCEHDEHEAIVKCIERGDADGAVRLMDQHLQELERNVCLQTEARAPGLKELLGL